MAENEKCVDVLMTVYNGAKYIKDSVDSVINQTYSNWKLFIIDDGSTDDTLKICSEYATKDSRIQVFHQENAGTVVTRKRLMEKVTADYYMFFDADDLLHPQIIETFVDVAEKEDADIVLGEAVQNVSRKNCVGKNMTQFSEKPSYETVSGETVSMGMVGYPKFDVIVNNKLFRNSVKDTDLSSVPDMFVGEDACMNMMFFENVAKAAVVKARLYNYRMGGFSSRYYDKLAEDIVKLYNWKNAFIDRKAWDERKKVSNLINALHTYRSISAGCVVKGRADYETLKELVDELKKQNRDKSLVEFYEGMGKQEMFSVPKEKYGVKISIKRWILNNL